MSFSLPALNFSTDALEPHIDGSDAPAGMDGGTLPPVDMAPEPPSPFAPLAPL